MDILNSNKVTNGVHVKSIVIAVIIHLYFAAMSFGGSLVLILITGLITASLCKKEVGNATSNASIFSKNFPFKYYGETIGDFQHVFHHSETLEKKLYEAIETELKEKTPITNFETITITDTDKDLSITEPREFIKAESDATIRGTAVTLILNQASFGAMRSIEWRVLAGGYVDRNKKFNLIAYSIFTFWFWIIPYIKGTHDLLSKVRTIYPGSYNDMDVMTQIRCLHQAVFDAMIDELEKNDIDTSELKAQKMQVMNISISGGKVNMGNVVQGAMNKVTSRVKGNKS